MRCGTQGYVVEPREPMRRLGGAQVVWTCGRGHASLRGRPGGATWREGGGAGSWRAHGLVGPSKSIGEVRQ